jgi:hypothetical protein
LPTVIVVGAMKCATSALHAYLDAHPDVQMSEPKELNFFNGPDHPPHDDPNRWWLDGQWHRGVDWYASCFDARFPVRGESSPAYTSPTCPEVPARMASVVPDVRLLYLVRDPLARALSQYAHHRREGDEPRSPEEALLDPASQYVARSRYHERIEPFLHHFDRGRLRVVVQERLLSDRRAELAGVFAHLGLPAVWHEDHHTRRHHLGDLAPTVDEAVRAAFRAEVRDDVARLRALLDDDLEEWSGHG